MVFAAPRIFLAKKIKVSRKRFRRQVAGEAGAITRVADHRGQEDLAGMGETWTGLEEVYLNGSQVTDNGLRQLLNCENLRILAMAGTGVTDEGLAILRQIKTLTTLAVPATKVTEDGVKKFAAALPKCRIEWDGGVIEPRMTDDPDRRAAEWVLSVKGSIRIRENGEERDVGNVAGLPDGAFELIGTRVTNLEEKVINEGLSKFAGCRNLVTLSIADCPKVSDVGFSHFRECKKLQQLTLSRVSISDAGLAHFDGCENLELLSIETEEPATAIGMTSFRSCRQLTTLSLVIPSLDDACLSHTS